MSLFDIFKKKPPKNTKYANMLNGYTPIFSQFGDNIYASDVVQQAIYCIVTEIKKLSPQHVKLNGSDVTSMNSGLQAVLENPNPLMTKSDFLEKSCGSYILTTIVLSCQHTILGRIAMARKSVPILDYIQYNPHLWSLFKMYRKHST